MFRTIDETLLVTGQISPDDIATAAAQGVRTIINNRPDGEQPGQPTIDSERAVHRLQFSQGNVGCSRSILVRGTGCEYHRDGCYPPPIRIWNQNL